MSTDKERAAARVVLIEEAISHGRWVGIPSNHKGDTVRMLVKPLLEAGVLNFEIDWTQFGAVFFRVTKSRKDLRL